MAFSDQFTKIVFVNKNDPAFIEGVSPSISAEHLNAVQDGVVNALADADSLDARLKTEESNTDELFNGVLGVRCETVNTSVTIATGDWVEDVQNMRFTAQIFNSAIREDTDVELVLADSDKGKYSINALDPVTGSVTLFSGSAPKQDLTFRLIVTEVRKID